MVSNVYCGKSSNNYRNQGIRSIERVSAQCMLFPTPTIQILKKNILV